MSDTPSRSRSTPDAPSQTATRRDGAAEQAFSETLAELGAILTPAERTSHEAFRSAVAAMNTSVTREQLIALGNQYLDPWALRTFLKIYDAHEAPVTREATLAVVNEEMVANLDTILTRGTGERNREAEARDVPDAFAQLDETEIATALMSDPELSQAKLGYLREELTRVQASVAELTAQLTALGLFEPLDAGEARILGALREVLNPREHEALVAAFEEERTLPTRGQRIPPAASALLRTMWRSGREDDAERIENAVATETIDALRRVLRGLAAHPEARPLYGRLMGLTKHRTLLSTQLEEETMREGEAR